MRIARPLAPLLVLAALSGCGSSSPTTVITISGYTVVVTSAPPSTAPVGTTIPIAFTLTAHKSDGTSAPASGKSFTVTVTAGGGTVNGAATATVTSDASGSVAGTWVLGPSAGTQTIRGAVSTTEYLDINVVATALPPTQLVLATAPSASASSGVAFAQQPAVQLKDANGGNAAQAGVVVTAAISSGGGTLGTGLTATTDATGLATFSGLAITGTVGSRTLTFTATLASGAASVNSGAIAITAGAATQLVLLTAPSTAAQSGVVLVQQPSVQLQDASGNTVSQAGIVVTASIASGGGTLATTLTATTNASGVATFADLAISGLVGNRTLSFAATLGGQPATVLSAAIALTAGVAAQITLTTQPSSSSPTGFLLLQQPVIQVRDAAGNGVAQAGIVVTASVASGPALLAGSLVANSDANGVATFTTLKFIGTPGPTAVKFTGSYGIVGGTVTSAPITVTLPANGKIVFKSGSDAIWVVNPDGTGRLQLTPGYGNSTCTSGDEEPRWSPDGSKIVFTRMQNGSQDIWVMNADGSNQTRLTNSGNGACDDSSAPSATYSENPSWSPDGTKIIFTSDRSATVNDEDLWIMNADGSGQAKFFGVASSFESEAVFSPDGRTIVYQVEPDNTGSGCGGDVTLGGEMWLLNGDGTNPRRVTTLANCSFDENYGWSADGQKITYTRGNAGMACSDEVFIINADGSNRTQLTNCLGTSGSEHPWFAPNGMKIVFANGAEGDQIWLMNPDGSGPVAINLGGLTSNGQPNWQPIRP